MPPSPSLQGPKAGWVEAPLSNRGARSPGSEGKGQEEPVQRIWPPSSGSSLLGQSEKSLLEQLESMGLLASEWSDASRSTESHLASIIVKKHLRENKTVGAHEDPLAYWKKRRDIWPALARLATTYLSCPAPPADKRLLCKRLCLPGQPHHHGVQLPAPGGDV